MVYTEFVSSEGLIRNAAKSVMKLDIYEKERPVGIQIFGANMESMLQTIDIVERSNPDIARFTTSSSVSLIKITTLVESSFDSINPSADCTAGFHPAIIKCL